MTSTTEKLVWQEWEKRYKSHPNGICKDGIILYEKEKNIERAIIESCSS